MFGFGRRTRHKEQQSDQGGGDATGSIDRSVSPLLYSAALAFEIYLVIRIQLMVTYTAFANSRQPAVWTFPAWRK